MSGISPEVVRENDVFAGSRTSWRRRINRSAAPVAAITGIVLVFAAAVFLEDVLVRVAMIAAGILVVEAGVWYMANPIFTSERRYPALRGELDNLIDLVRQLNHAVVDGVGRDEVERLKAALHDSVEEMGRLAGKGGKN